MLLPLKPPPGGFFLPPPQSFEFQNKISIFAKSRVMRIFTEQALKEYIVQHQEAKVPLQDWAVKVKKSTWRCFADVKRTFNSVDNVGNQHYVFNIKGNNYRLVVVIKFTIQFVYIRFIGTHKEYEQIDSANI